MQRLTFLVALAVIAATAGLNLTPDIASARPLSDDCQPTSPLWQPTPGRSIVVDRGLPECNTVSLTFDAGADRGYAELILDILRDTGVKASFGMTGLWAQQNPDLVVRMVGEGHELINHTWRHGSFTGFSTNSRPLTVDVRASELERTEELLKGLTGQSTHPMFRPPYGDLNEGVLKDVADQGYDYTIMWTVDSLGWNHLGRRGIIDRCLSRAAPGTIYIFHVGAESEDALALGPIIDGLRDRGLRTVKISEMIGLKPQAGAVPGPADTAPPAPDESQPAP
ncbi:MAG TPA: polysaccharide deacetylase family protein [Chloroflexota bacterium]|nr:polysaccharide deacetylase family protein [Chloroflexota bacterium]